MNASEIQIQSPQTLLLTLGVRAAAEAGDGGVHHRDTVLQRDQDVRQGLHVGQGVREGLKMTRDSVQVNYDHKLTAPLTCP